MSTIRAAINNGLVDGKVHTRIRARACAEKTVSHRFCDLWAPRRRCAADVTLIYNPTAPANAADGRVRESLVALPRKRLMVFLAAGSPLPAPRRRRRSFILRRADNGVLWNNPVLLARYTAIRHIDSPQPPAAPKTPSRKRGTSTPCVRAASCAADWPLSAPRPGPARASGMSGPAAPARPAISHGRGAA